MFVCSETEKKKVMNGKIEENKEEMEKFAMSSLNFNGVEIPIKTGG